MSTPATAKSHDGGSIMVASIGFIVICILAVGVVVDVTSVFIARRSLQAAVDSAALAGAQAIDLPTYYQQGAGAGIVLEAAQVRARVRAQLRSTPEVVLTRVQLDSEVVVVTARTTMRPPMSGWLTGLGTQTLTAQAGAQLMYRPG